MPAPASAPTPRPLPKPKLISTTTTTTITTATITDLPSPIPLFPTLPSPPSLDLLVGFSNSAKRENIFTQLASASSHFRYHFPPSSSSPLSSLSVRLRLIPLQHPSHLPSTNPPPLHALLHKRNDQMAAVLASADPAAVSSISRLNATLTTPFPAFPGRKPAGYVIPIDPLNAAWNLLDRKRILQAVDRIHHPTHSSHNSPSPSLRATIRPLAWLCFNTRQDQSSVRAALHNTLRFPLILKRRLACGNDESHEMAIAYTLDGAINALRTVFGEGKDRVSPTHAPNRQAMDCPIAEDISNDMIAQEYVEDHGGVLFKAYAVADRVALQTRSTALHDLQEPDDGFYYYNPHHVKNIRVRHGVEHIKKCAREALFVPPSNQLATEVAQILLEDLGVTLFGVDMIFDRQSGKYSVIDVNYFPSYRGVDGAMDWILEHICKLVAARVEGPPR